MSFGFGVTDFINLGKLAYKLFQACEGAYTVFQELAQQCLCIYVVVGQSLRSLRGPSQKNQNYDIQVKLSVLTSGCRYTLTRLERLISKYASLGSASPTAWDTLTFALRMLITNDISELRAQLSFHLAALGIFMTAIQSNAFDEVVAKFDQMSITSFSKADQKSSQVALKMSLGTQPFHSRRGDVCAPLESQQMADCTPEAVRNAIEVKRQRLQAVLDPITDLSPWMSLMSAAQQATIRLSPQAFHYSKTDERLSLLPEGWQRIMLNRNTYHYRYLLSSKVICSSIYSLKEPFNTTLDVAVTTLPPGWVEGSSASRGPYYFRPSDGTTQFTRPSLRVSDHSDGHYVGWITKDGLPLEMNDSCSVELARALYIDQDTPWDDIKNKLSDFTAWNCIDDHNNKPVYIKTTATGKESGYPEITSTVHPAYFLDANGHDSGRLPPGWDRRLDTWGNVFFVDHNTSTAQRQHPKDDAVTNLSTGLPHGWEASTDHNGVRYFFETATLLATYQTTSLRTAGREMKFALRRRPRPGEIPPLDDGEILQKTGVSVGLSYGGDDDDDTRLDAATIVVHDPDALHVSYPLRNDDGSPSIRLEGGGGIAGMMTRRRRRDSI